MELLLTVSPADICHTLFCGSQILKIDISAGIQRLKMLKHHSVSRASPHFEMYPAGQILAKVDHRIAPGCGEDLLCRKLIHLPYTASRLAAQDLPVRLQDAHSMPSLRVKTRAAPGRLLQSRVIRLPVINLGKQHRAVVSGPAGIRCHNLTGSVRIVQMDFPGKCCRAAVQIFSSVKSHRPLKPSGSQMRARRVLPLYQILCHIVDLIQQMLLVRCPARGKLVRAHLSAVQIKMVQPLRRRRRVCRFQRLFHSKFFSHKSSLGDFLIFRLFRGDKRSLPVLRGSEPCDKYRSLTPGTLLPVSVPDHDSGKIFCQRLP